MLFPLSSINSIAIIFLQDWERQNEGWTPLHVACTTDRIAVIELLLAHGADVNTKTKNGCVPLALAQEREFDEIVELLRKHGAEEELEKKYKLEIK